MKGLASADACVSPAADSNALKRPFRARLELHPALAAAMETDGSLPASSAAYISAEASRTCTRYHAHNLFADVHEAVRWRDEQFFKAFGTCALFAKCTSLERVHVQLTQAESDRISGTLHGSAAQRIWSVSRDTAFCHDA